MTAGRGWWRRNAVALCAALPVLAVGGWMAGDGYRNVYLGQTPHQQVRPAADGWLTLPGIRFRLDAVTPVNAGSTTPSGVDAPQGTKKWRLTGTVEAADRPADSSSAVAVCGLILIGDDGNSYSAGASAMSNGNARSCLNMNDTNNTDDADPVATAGVRGETEFLLPADTVPNELRIKDLAYAPVLGVVPIDQRLLAAGG